MTLSMLIAALIPEIIEEISGFFGFIVSSNFIFVLAILFIMLIILSITAIISHMNSRIFRLVQEQALLEKRVRELEQLGMKENGDKNEID